MDVVMFADTMRSADLRHVVPVPIMDPFIYVEHGRDRVAFMFSIEIPRVREHAVDLEIVSYEELGLDQLRRKGVPTSAAVLELLHRACTSLGIVEAIAPDDFPLVATHLLRRHGIEVRPDSAVFAARRRAKTAVEIEGIRRAQAATEAAMATIRDAIRRGGAISSESLRAAARRQGADADVFFEYMIVAHGAQAASIHETGSGPIAAGEPIVVDLGVRDRASGCWADMTRTFCIGDPPEELVAYHRLCREVLAHVMPLVRPGVSAAELHRRADAIIAGAGYPTLLTKQPGTVLEDGFLHSLGHGVGLELHEAPSLGLNGEDLVAGDVITIEPGVYRRGFGGCRLEDLVLVTGDGCEVLTDFPYELG